MVRGNEGWTQSAFTPLLSSLSELQRVSLAPCSLQGTLKSGANGERLADRSDYPNGCQITYNHIQLISTHCPIPLVSELGCSNIATTIKSKFTIVSWYHQCNRGYSTRIAPLHSIQLTGMQRSRTHSHAKDLISLQRTTTSAKSNCEFGAQSPTNQVVKSLTTGNFGRDLVMPSGCSVDPVHQARTIGVKPNEPRCCIKRGKPMPSELIRTRIKLAAGVTGQDALNPFAAKVAVRRLCFAAALPTWQFNCSVGGRQTPSNDTPEWMGKK
ncbi:hypothetical protein H257_01535 [Aphanomyces astaci]|uniref:Uncharacterized protein n=1 Tax=Aphanomyces astaci TaxID=112090 RepID=W4H873_APHAT|nr:hypothetical protein H257_01535 [Aphanomyces astaci]ETV88230.1 hypothetical protein H257_01535 [Aphanomyces astaci]|eukprot:XP_009823093.1 hypothetical protein H257_01535 [Aphanomyces astaci]